MTDNEPDITSYPINDRDNVPTIFVNELAGRGFVNGVVNLTFTVNQFTPTTDAKVIVDTKIASRLRMDLYCAGQLHAALGAILEANTIPPKDTKAN